MSYIAIIFTIFAIIIGLNSHSALQEIEASIILLMSVILFCTAKISKLLEQLILKNTVKSESEYERVTKELGELLKNELIKK